MKTIKLLNLALKNFKGIKAFELDVNGGGVRILGDNATGKTTLYDSFLWLLFGKDSNNRADFAIKTLDENGREINNLEHAVEARFWITDPNAPDEEKSKALVLKKVYKEKYTKKRGQATAEFTGHETNHYIDDVPVKKKEYEDKIKSLVNEEVFKLITSPTYFNENLKWQDRRKTLLEICGDIGLDDVVAANPQLKDLPTILQGRAVEDHKKVIAEKRKAINKELEMIPVRIDELNNSMPEKIDVTSIEAEVATIEKQLDEHATQINNIKNGAAIVDLEALAKTLEFELKQIQNELEAEATEKGFQVQTKIQEEQSNLAILKRGIDDNKQESTKVKAEIEAIDKQLPELRNEWQVVNERAFDSSHNADTCPTCNQSLPVEEVQAAHDKALSDFNLKKSAELEEINAKGKRLSGKKEGLLKRIESTEKEIEVLLPQIEAKEKAIGKLLSELDTLRTEIKNARQDERYISKTKEIENVDKQIQTLKENAQQAVSDVEKEVISLRAERAKLNEEIAKQAQIKVNQKRIAELEEQQKELATEFEQLEKELFLTEEFTRSKVELLEERINSKFKFARFKLFANQINGGLTEACETTVNGVPYGSGLNNAAKINVGLDIINTLTAHYGIQAPIFVDNAEAVTQLIDIDSQLISLVVSEQDKELRIETESESVEGVA